MAKNDDGMCPKCKELLPDNPGLWRKMNPVEVRNALSRRDNKTYICNICGNAEAMADFKGVTDQEARRIVEPWAWALE